MKVNLKKIGAIVAGATILASSAAFAGLLFGSTTLVDDNGAPVAKVVVGSKAAPSDGVAAALIAGKIVSEAYKSQVLTAQVSGTATCSAGNASSGGTCAISNEKAKLEITVPGTTAAGTWLGNNLIGDFLNRQLLDRKANTAASGTDANYTFGSDTSDSANPFSDGTASGNLGSSESYFYRINGEAYTPLAQKTIMDSDANNQYVETQDLWVKGYNKYSTSEKDVVGHLDFLAYSLKFKGPGSADLGIPVCTQATNGSYADCGSTSSYLTSTHKVKVWFLGEEWILSDMSQSDVTDQSTENTLDAGGYIKLAKESISGILNAGESLPVDNLKFVLDDLEAHGETTSAIISVIDANGNLKKKDKVDPGTTKEITVDGKSYNFHVYKVAPGYTYGAKWADVAVFAQEMKLDDGEKLDSDKAKNDVYSVALGWKSKSGSSDSDHLRSVIVYSSDLQDATSGLNNDLKAGESLNLVQSPAAWKLSFKGLDLASSDKSSLKFQLKSEDLSISTSKGPVFSSTQVDCTIYGPYMKVTSGSSGSIFEVGTRTDNAGSGSLSSNEFLVALSNVTSNKGAICNTTSSGTTLYWFSPGSVFMKVSPTSDDYGVLNMTNAVTETVGSDGGTGGWLEVKYSKIGDGDTEFIPTKGGAIVIEQMTPILHALNGTASGGLSFLDGSSTGHIGKLLNTSGYSVGTYSLAANGTIPQCAVTPAASSTCPDFMFAVAEKAGVGTSNDFVDYFTFGMDGAATPSSATFDFASVTNTSLPFTSDSNKILYTHALRYSNFSQTLSGPKDTNTSLVDEGYVSERGSAFKDVASDAVTFTMAHKLAKAQWYLAPSSLTSTSSSATIATLKEGESTTVSGVTVKVAEITEDVGACSAAGAAAACTADMKGVSAVIMPNNAASVSVAVPYSGSYSNVVILDSDAVGVNTLVSVGGDKVNSVTAGLLQGSAVDWSAEKKVVKEVVQGSKIVVAGKDASDTLEAAQDFVAKVQKVK